VCTRLREGRESAEAVSGETKRREHRRGGQGQGGQGQGGKVQGGRVREGRRGWAGAGWAGKVGQAKKAGRVGRKRFAEVVAEDVSCAEAWGGRPWGRSRPPLGAAAPWRLSRVGLLPLACCLWPLR